MVAYNRTKLVVIPRMRLKPRRFKRTKAHNRTTFRGRGTAIIGNNVFPFEPATPVDVSYWEVQHNIKRRERKLAYCKPLRRFYDSW